MNRRNILPMGFFLVILGILSSCSWLQRRSMVKKCKFKIASIIPSEYSITNPRYIYLATRIDIYNPNNGEALLEPFEWRFLVEGKQVAKGKSKKQLTIPPFANRKLNLKIKVDLWLCSKAIIKTVLRGSAKYRMEATVYLNTPFGSMEYEVLIQEKKWSTGF